MHNAAQRKYKSLSFNPPHLIPLVEVSGGKQASVENGPTMRELAQDIGAYPETDDYIAQVTQGVEEELNELT